MTRNVARDEGARAYLRPPAGNSAFYSREYLASVRSMVLKAWSTTGPNNIKREVALTLLADPELRLRICHLEEILHARQLAARQQTNGYPHVAGNLNGCHGGTPSHQGANHNGNGTANHLNHNGAIVPVQLQTALADPSFAALFELDSSVHDPDWGMQVLWLNMTALQRELGLPPPLPSPPPPPPPAAVVALPPTPFDTTSATGGGSAVVVPSSSPPALPSSPADPTTLLHAAEQAFLNHPTDDGDYLALAAAHCLATRRDPKAILPALSLHLSDLVACLCAYAAADGRLAAALQRLATQPRSSSGGGGGSAAGASPTSTAALAARLGEFMGGPRVRMGFRQSESLARKGERVVSLAVEQLTRHGSTPRAPAGSGGGSNGNGLPYETWQRTLPAAGGGVAASGGVGPGGGSGAPYGDSLPVFLFEYEAPADLSYGRDDMAAAAASRRDQYGSSNVPAAVRSSPASSGGGAAPPAVGHASGRATTGQAPPAAMQLARQASQQPQQQPQPPFPSGPLLQHSWSVGHGATATAAAAVAALHPATSEPAPLPDSIALAAMAAGESGMPQPPSLSLSADAISPSSPAGPAATLSLPRRMTEPCAPVGGGGASFSLGVTEWSGGGKAAPSAEGGSLGGSFTGGPRLPPLYEGTGSASDMLFQHSLAAVAAGAGVPQPPPPPPPQASLGILSASPSGAAGELFVPQEIAEVWSNAGLGAGGGGGGSAPATATAARRVSVTAAGSVATASGLPGDVGTFGGVFAMSPTHESSHIWERVPARAGTQPGLDGSNGTTVNVNRAGTVDLGSFNLGGTFPGGFDGIGGGGGGGLVVGSAPPGIMPPFLYGGIGSGVGDGGGGIGGFPGNGGGSGFAAAPGLLDFASWQSSSAALSSSVGGRSAPAEDGPGGSWLLAHGTRVANGGCGGGVASAAAAADRMFAAVAAAAAASSAQEGGAAAAAAAAAAAGAREAREAGRTGPSPSVSEESEEAVSVVGGLELDPVAMTLEFIGLDRLDPGAANIVQAKGLIAAAAAPKTSAATAGAMTPQSTKSFASVASTNSTVNGFTAATAGGLGLGGGAAGLDGTSPHSSLDSCDALPGGSGGAAGANAAATAAVLTGWSAMAARGPSVPTAQGMQQQLAAAAAAAAAGGGRLPGGSAATAASTQAVVQGLAATMAAAMASVARPSTNLGLNPGSILAGISSLQSANAGRDPFSGKVLHPKLTQRVREEICQLVRSVPGLKAEDFDDGVLHQLTLKKSEDEAVGALRTLAAENLSGIQHMAAYINHIIKNYHLTGGAHGGAGGVGLTAASLPSATVRANSTPVSSKAILQKLPLRVYRRLEEVINKCSHMEWKHFDAGVVKVMAQLAEIGEEDVFEELELLKSTDLSNVEYMPAYLNKRLNNRLWARRKMLTSAGVAGAAVGL